MAKRQQLEAKKEDYFLRSSRWLAEGNQASEGGKRKKAERCYEKSQFWLDRANATQEKIWLLGDRT